MIDLNYYSQLNDDEKFQVLKSFEGHNVKNLQLENMKHKMNIVEVLDLENIVVRLVNLEDDNKTRLEFLEENEFIYYLAKVNNKSKGVIYGKEIKVETCC